MCTCVSYMCACVCLCVLVSQNGNEIVAPFTSRSSVYESHDISVSFELMGESCEDGYVATHSCNNCDYSWSETDYSHNFYSINSVDLGELGGCGGHARVSSCACGSNIDVNWYLECDYKRKSYEVTENGINYTIVELYCDECGANVVTKSHVVKGTCEDITYSTFSIFLGDVALISDVSQSHIS